MNHRKVQGIAEEMLAWCNDPPADFDSLILHKSRQLEELVRTARECPPEVTHG